MCGWDHANSGVNAGTIHLKIRVGGDSLFGLCCLIGGTCRSYPQALDRRLDRAVVFVTVNALNISDCWTGSSTLRATR